MRKLLINKTNGYTLIEIMIVIAIIGTLAAIATPNYFRYHQKAMVTKVISDIKRIEKEIMFFQMDNVDLPVSLAEIGLGSLLDPWGNPYVYLRPGPRNMAYDIVTYGGDAEPGGDGEDADLILSEM